MLTYDLSEKNKYYDLYRHIRGDILGGALKAGEKLPGKRTLASHLGVSVITVQTAYEQLLAEGYITSAERKGYFVAEVAQSPDIEESGRSEEQEGACDVREDDGEYSLDLVTGVAPAGLFPFSVWAKLMRETLSEEGEHLLARVPADGDKQLKRSLAAYLYRARGVKVNPAYIVVGAGAEYLYGTIVQLLGRERVYAVENPGYGSISRTYKLYGARVAGISVGESGADCAEVGASGACALHVSPSHQYPTGAIMPAANRARLIKWARENDAYIVEDDYDSEFRLFGKPLQTMLGMNDERVIYLNTFSKTLAPSMRMGYMVLPPALYARFCDIFGGAANSVPLFEQKTLSKMLDGGYFERHVSRMKNYYRGVREKLLAAVDAIPCRKQIIETGGGLHLTLRLADFTSDGEIKERARALGVRVKCLSDYLISPRSDCERIAVINYSGASADGIERALGRLREGL